MHVAIVTRTEVFQTNPADVLPTPTLNVVATFNLLNPVPTNRALLHILFFPLAPLTEGRIRVLLELPVLLARHKRVVLQVTTRARLHVTRPAHKRLSFHTGSCHLVNRRAVG